MTACFKIKWVNLFNIKAGAWCANKDVKLPLQMSHYSMSNATQTPTHFIAHNTT